MKKILSLFFATLLLLGLIGCSGGVSQEDYDKVLAENSSLKEENEQLKKDCDYYLTGWAEEKAKNTTSQVDSGDNVSGEKDGKQETEVYSDNFVRICYSRCEESKYYKYDGEYNVVFAVENKNEKPIIIGVNSLSIDGWNLSDAFVSREISANSKGEVKIRSEELKTLTPSKVSGNLYIADKSKELWGSITYDAIFTDIEIQ